MTRCNKRKPQTVNKGREQRISFSCIHVLCHLQSFFHSFHSYGYIVSIYFFHYLFQLPLPIVFMVGVCLLVDAFPPFFKMRLTFVVRLCWLYFFFSSAPFFQIPNSSFTPRSNLSFVIIVVHLT